MTVDKSYFEKASQEAFANYSYANGVTDAPKEATDDSVVRSVLKEKILGLSVGFILGVTVAFLATKALFKSNG